ncbi:MAG: DUF1330 domain-containing protein [Blautia sp.]
MVYFAAGIFEDSRKAGREYESYIQEVKPIVERYGGKYLARSEKLTPLSEKWRPKRFILIQWETLEQLQSCFGSEEYQRIAGKRKNSVDSQGLIVEV